MSVFNKLNDKSLLLLLNQINEDFLEEGVETSNFVEFIENFDIVQKKCSYFGIDNIDRTDMTYLFALFQDLDDEGEITELPRRPKLDNYKVVWREVATEYNEYFYESKIESYCDLSTHDMEVLRSEDWFEPWGGKLVGKENLDYETTDDECESVKRINK